MAKHAIIVHGWDGYPEEGWFPWLKRELEARGFAVSVPQMPEADSPKIGPWVHALAETVGVPDENTYLIGHSIGCQTILRYLASIETKIGGAVFVAGFFTLTLDEGPEIDAIFEPWRTVPIDLERVKKNMGNVMAIFSDDDPYVPLENAAAFESGLGIRTRIMKNMGHFSGSNGITELPVALEELLKMST